MMEHSISTQEQAMLALARANVYNFLAAAFAAPPTVEMIAKLGDGALRAAFRSFETARPYLADLELALVERGGDGLADQLAVEHRRLFVGPGPGYVAPYQSVYTDKQTIDICGMRDSGIHPSSKTVDGLLWGNSTVGTLQSYREAGVEPVGDLAGVPDHLALQLQFMQHLCSREAAAWNAERPEEAAFWVRRQIYFLTTHLASWVDRFATRVTGEARHPWYRIIAALTAELVAEELAEPAAAFSPVDPELTPCSA